MQVKWLYLDDYYLYYIDNQYNVKLRQNFDICKQRAGCFKIWQLWRGACKIFSYIFESFYCSQNAFSLHGFSNLTHWDSRGTHLSYLDVFISTWIHSTQCSTISHSLSSSILQEENKKWFLPEKSIVNVWSVTLFVYLCISLIYL